MRTGGSWAHSPRPQHNNKNFVLVEDGVRIRIGIVLAQNSNGQQLLLKSLIVNFLKAEVFPRQ